MNNMEKESPYGWTFEILSKPPKKEACTSKNSKAKKEWEVAGSMKFVPPAEADMHHEIHPRCREGTHRILKKEGSKGTDCKLVKKCTERPRPFWNKESNNLSGKKPQI